MTVLDTRYYEMMFVVGADLDEEQLESLVGRIQRYLETAEAEVYSIKSWGLRRLAYTLKGQREGRYYLAQFAAPTQTVNDLDRNVRMIEGVLRHILIQLDKAPAVEVTPEPVAAPPVAVTQVAETPAEETVVAEPEVLETPAAAEPEVAPQPETDEEAPAESEAETTA